jgi:hypothetical protein
MALMLGRTTGRCTVDFAFFSVRQDLDADAESGTFVGTAPGAIVALCGRKNAGVIVSVERWDGPPPLASGWEDTDEVPYLELPGGGAARVYGFDPEPVSEPLDLTGIGRALVRVLARGRQDSTGYSDIAEHPPEEWLLQLYPDPDPDGTDPVALGPRRLAGDAPFGFPRTAWWRAVDAWAEAGWEPVLGAVPGYRELLGALRTVGRPASVADVLASAGVYVRGSGWTVPDSSTPVPGLDRPGPGRDGVMVVIERALRLADGAVPPTTEPSGLATYGDLVDLLVRLDLLLPVVRDGVTRLVPNPAPPPAWDADGIEEPLRHATRLSALRDHRRTADDIRTLLFWSAHLSTCTSARRLAVRLGTTPQDALGALRLLDLDGELRSDQPVGGLGVDDRVWISYAGEGPATET